MEEKRERIKKWMAACLLVTAFSIDLIEMLFEWLGIGLIINIITTPAVTLIFWIWFKLLSVEFVASPKRFLTLFVTSIGELVPGLDAVGGFLWTLGTLAIIILVRLEDGGGMIGNLATTSMNMMKQRYSARPDLYRNHQIAMQNKDILAFKQGDIENEAVINNPEFSKDQYQKGIGMAGDVISKNINSQSRRQFLGMKERE